MKEIAKGVYLENSYPGVMTAALILPKGGILIDAPPRPDDAHAWLATLRGVGMSGERVLISLDAHADRTLGARYLDCISIAQAEVKTLFKSRPAIFKAQRAESGAEWELLTGLSGVRWQRPSVYFTKRSFMNWGGTQVVLEHHPGPQPGASWVILPDEKIVFIGDTVVTKQPPFFAFANIEQWNESLDLLLSQEYSDYKILSSRSGVVGEKDIKEMKKVLKEVEKRMSKLDRKGGKLESIEGWVDKLFSLTNSLKKHKTQYSQRLRYGLKQYYIHQYLELESE